MITSLIKFTDDRKSYAFGVMLILYAAMCIISQTDIDERILALLGGGGVISLKHAAKKGAER